MREKRKARKERRKIVREALKMELAEHRSSWRVYLTLRVLVLLMMVFQFLSGNYEAVFICGLTLILFLLPSYIQVTLKIELPTILEIILLLFIFAAEILGEVKEYYLVFPYWDTVLHTLCGFLAAAVGFSLVELLNRSDKLVFQLSPLFIVIVSFCFSMTIGVIWEFFEFGMDQFCGLDMQKDTIIHGISSVMLNPDGRNLPVGLYGITEMAINGKDLGLGGYLDIGLIDTMQDLIVNFIGAVTFSVFGFLYLKSKDENSFVGKLIPRMKKKERDFLRIAEENARKEKEARAKKHEKN